MNWAEVGLTALLVVLPILGGVFIARRRLIPSLLPEVLPVLEEYGKQRVAPMALAYLKEEALPAAWTYFENRMNLTLANMAKGEGGEAPGLNLGNLTSLIPGSAGGLGDLAGLLSLFQGLGGNNGPAGLLGGGGGGSHAPGLKR